MKALFKTLSDSTLVRFGLIGVLNTLVGTAIMFSLYNLAGFSYWASSFANYFLTSILSFFLNKYFTFRSHGRLLREAVRFFLNIAVCYTLAYAVAKPLTLHFLAGTSKTLSENVALIVGMCLFVTLNYCGQRFFAFRKSEEN